MGCNIYMHFCPTKKLTNNDLEHEKWPSTMLVKMLLREPAWMILYSLLSDQRVSSTCDVGK